MPAGSHSNHFDFAQEDRVAMFRAICSTDFKYPAHFSKVGGWRGSGWMSQPN